ncbi:STAS domain-containing protein [Nocardioides bizhenqiangii]|uniref:Anti-sigma factor antagonist n=1 Tax=Nocardioides bizhenqiangii TaxID=3095076 RepID=A0ABZ0ZQ85_9ACTN|nr:MULTISPECIES: STAS domain-containing protein [unclassified Nocardioides]MDZ5620062.1 STAS domain-containing protein [Nocardioides sp. HM23]WQQ25936.1 STAS domain-containing protein [Nocardioides sp. HM61]
MAQFSQDTSVDGSTVVRAVGEVDLSTAQDLAAAVRPCLADGESVVLDLSGVEFIDSSGLGTLVQLLKEAARNGASLTLGGVTASTYRLLEVTGLAAVFDVRLANKGSDGVAST